MIDEAGEIDEIHENNNIGWTVLGIEDDLGVEEMLIFLRGDCDGDGKVGGSPTDAVLLLTWAFRGGDEPPCLAACDFNADGSVSGSPTDAVGILAFAFQTGDPPPAPFPECGPATKSDAGLGCQNPPAACQ